MKRFAIPIIVATGFLLAYVIGYFILYRTCSEMDGPRIIMRFHRDFLGESLYYLYLPMNNIAHVNSGFYLYLGFPNFE